MKRAMACLWLVGGLVGGPVWAAPAEPQAEVASAATEFVRQLSYGEFAGAAGRFDATMTRALPADKLRETWQSLIAQAGAFRRQAGLRSEAFQQYRIVFVTCEFEKAPLDVKVVFDRAGRIAGLFFLPSQGAAPYEPPAYAKPDAFVERDVVVGATGWPLPGTLSMPKGPGPFPAVVLVHGSGPQDRDETLGPNKPFRDLASGLASRGVAVLRYEKRTRQFAGKLAGLVRDITVREETVDDAAAAAAFLRGTEGINPRRVFVLGHSLGGTLVPRIAAAAPDAAGFIIMAGSARPLEDVIIEQLEYIFNLDGDLSDAEKKHLEGVRRQAARVKDPNLAADAPASGLPLGVPAGYWLDLRDYRPAEAARKLRQPMLILQGLRDYQVTTADLQLWKDALSDRKDVAFAAYPKLNHLFIEGVGKCTPAEYLAAGHVAPAVIDDIAAWIGGTRPERLSPPRHEEAP